MKKITKATFKSFIKNNDKKLYILSESRFDGMIDGLAYSQQKEFKNLLKDIPNEFDIDRLNKTGKTNEEILELYVNNKNTLGYKGIWLVNGGNDNFRKYEDDNFIGYYVFNSCGSFTVAIKKVA